MSVLTLFVAVPFVMIVVFFSVQPSSLHFANKGGYLFTYTSTTARDKEKSMTYFQVDNCGGCVFLMVETIICLLLSSIRSDPFCAVEFRSVFFLINGHARR